MKLYLDDCREAPFGWDLIKTAEECIEVLKTGKVEALSLDHDLGEHKTGYEVVLWMVQNNVWPADIIIHTMNPVGRQDMLAMIERHAPSSVGIAVVPGWRG